MTDTEIQKLIIQQDLKIEILEECRAFYANQDNWDNDYHIGKHVKYWTDYGYEYDMEHDLGKRARECGQKIKDLK